MDARPLLARIAKVLEEQNLEAVLIGNAAAALQGAPVTTVDFDFMFRKTPANLRKLKALARALDAVILRPYYPVSDLFRIVRDEDGLQLDFMTTVHGVRSLASLRSRARKMALGDARLLVATLADIEKTGFRMSDVGFQEPRASGQCLQRSRRHPKSEIRNPLQSG